MTGVVSECGDIDTHIAGPGLSRCYGGVALLCASAGRLW